MRKYINLFILFLALIISNSAFAEDEFGYGIELIKQSGSIFVNDVIINSNADKAGLFKSNVIVSINGKTSSDLTEEYLKDIDKQEKIILLTSENKKISLKPENLTILDKYNKFIKYQRFPKKFEKRARKVVSDPTFNMDAFLEHRKKQEEEFVARQKRIEEGVINAKTTQAEGLSAVEKSFQKNNISKATNNNASINKSNVSNSTTNMSGVTSKLLGEKAFIPFVLYKSLPNEREFRPTEWNHNGERIYNQTIYANWKNTATYYNYKQYDKALSSINSVLSIAPNSPDAWLAKSQILNAKGDISSALNYLEKAIYVVENIDEWKYNTNSISFYPSSFSALYAYRAYLHTKTGNTAYISSIKSDIDKYIANPPSNVTSGYTVAQTDRLLGYAMIKELFYNPNIPSTMKDELYKYLRNKINQKWGAKEIFPLTVAYIQFINNLDDKDALFNKLGKNKNQITTPYIALLRGDYAQIEKGLLIIATGDYNKGMTEIKSALKQFPKNSQNLGYAISVIGRSFRILQSDNVNYFSLPNKLEVKDGIIVIYPYENTDLSIPYLPQSGILKYDNTQKYNKPCSSLDNAYRKEKLYYEM